MDQLQHDGIAPVPPSHALARELARLQGLVDLLPEPCLFTDDHGQITWANTAAGHMLVISPLELQGVALTRFVIPADQAALQDRMRTLLETGTVSRWDMVIVPRAGKQAIAVRAVAHAVDIRPGSAQSLCWTLTDQTESNKQRRAVQTLTEDMWMRVGELTAELSTKVERLERELADALSRAGSTVV